MVTLTIAGAGTTEMTTLALLRVSKVLLAVMVVVPGSWAATSPVGVTLATPGWLLVQLTLVGAPAVVATLALSPSVSPTRRVAPGGSMAMAPIDGAGATSLQAAIRQVARTLSSVRGGALRR